MKLRTVEDVIDALDQTSQRRKREMVTVKRLLDSGPDGDVKFASRSAIVLAYAHWEGFVRESAQAYVSYVDSLGLPLKALVVNLQALACRGFIKAAAQATKRIGLHLDVAGLFFDQSAQKVPIGRESIDTESNLTWEVFSDISLSLGIRSNKDWGTYSHFMNELYRQRCDVAHGGHLVPTRDYALEAVDTVVLFIDWFKSDVENAAAQAQFRRAS